MADNIDVTAGTGTTVATDDVSGVHYQRVKLVDGTLDSNTAIPGDATNGLDVDVTRIIPGTAATSLGKAEDAAHSSGDTGVMFLGVRNDSSGNQTSNDGDYSPISVDQQGRISLGIVGSATSSLGKQVDDAAGATDRGVAVLGIRTDSPAALTPVSGDYVQFRTNSAGALLVSPVSSNLVATSAGLTTSTTAYTSGDVLGSEWSWANAVHLAGGSGVINSLTLVNKATQLGATELWLFDRASSPAADNAANSWADADALNCVAVIPIPAPITSALNQIITVPLGNVAYTCNATTLYGTLVTRSGHTFFGAVGDLQIRLNVTKY